MAPLFARAERPYWRRWLHVQWFNLQRMLERDPLRARVPSDADIEWAREVLAYDDDGPSRVVERAIRHAALAVENSPDLKAASEALDDAQNAVRVARRAVGDE